MFVYKDQQTLFKVLQVGEGNLVISQFNNANTTRGLINNQYNLISTQLINYKFFTTQNIKIKQTELCILFINN